MFRAGKDYYRILEVDKKASAEEIKKAFHRLAMLHHPDRSTNAGEEQFKEINEAYQCLSNAGKRRTYDAGSMWVNIYTVPPSPYLFAEVSETTIKKNEEFEITYRYIGEGRFLKKPQSKDFVFTSGPIVDHKTIIINDAEVKETLLTYTVCAVSSGIIALEPATIEVGYKHLSSNKISIRVHANDCYFKSGMVAGDNPLIVRLHKEQFSSNSIYRKTYTYRHAVLIPRSDYAAFYHRIGTIMKVVFAICGTLLFALKGEQALIGLVCGSIVGGINCQLMYWMSGVRSKFFYAYKHPLVSDYLEQGYEMGNDSANFFISDNILQRLVMMFK